MKKDIYKLKLHEIVLNEQMRIHRVPGGWIYTYFSEDGNNSVFVPFNNEFEL